MLTIGTNVNTNSERLLTANLTKRELLRVFSVNRVSMTQNIIWHRKRYHEIGSVRNPGGVRTLIALHCGSFIFNMAVKAAKIGRF